MSRSGEFSTGAAYQAVRRSIDDLVRGLDAEQLATPAPACPGWSVHDIVAHCAGLAVDGVGGVGPDNLPAAVAGDIDAWTARHVVDRVERSTVEVLEEWRGVADEFAATLDAGRGRFPASLIDALCHEHDIRGAVQTFDGRPEFQTSLEKAMVGGWIRRIDAAGLAPILVVVPTGEPYDGELDATVICRTTPFFILRATLGRRSRIQIAHTISGASDTKPYIDALCHFPPSRKDIAF